MTTKTFYSYDALTGAYLTFGEAQESPEEQGVFLLPAWATFTPPPTDLPEGHAAFWDGEDEWFVLEATADDALLAAVGYLATPQEKAELIARWSMEHMDTSAKALGFKDLADAMTYPPGTNTQKQRDGQALREWRLAVDNKAAEITAREQSLLTPMPSPGAYVNELPRLQRDFGEVPPPVPVFVAPEEPMIKYAVEGSAPLVKAPTQEELAALQALNDANNIALGLPVYKGEVQ